jgi:hypothetical protein
MGADGTADMVGSLLKELSVAHVRFNPNGYTNAITRRRIYWTMVSSIRWYQSARRAAFTLRFTSMSRTEREVLAQHIAWLRLSPQVTATGRQQPALQGKRA